ncbi:MAG: ACP S-malonyltransferase [Gammaproteobacteria bacterium AqS3]|nr:ACP S-malonyltransferase [Gammaproteobacteria bacterium AqS3]
MLSASEGAVLHTFSQASEVLGYDLWKLISEGPEAQLNSTEFTQPALLCTSIALHRLWRERHGAEPACLAGHSLGEYSALVAGGALDFEDAVHLVQLRGRLMQQSLGEGEGAMAAILGLEAEVIGDFCRQAGGAVVAANLNAPGQTVISGERAAVEAVCALCKQGGARRALLLPVSVPSHSPLMEPVRAPFSEAIAGVSLRPASTPIIQNSTAAPHQSSDEIAANLTEQLTAPVRWVESVGRIQAMGVRSIVEIGPGKVLSGLNRRIAPDLTHLNVSQAGDIDGVVAALEETHE